MANYFYLQLSRVIFFFLIFLGASCIGACFSLCSLLSAYICGDNGNRWPTTVTKRFHVLGKTKRGYSKNKFQVSRVCFGNCTWILSDWSFSWSLKRSETVLHSTCLYHISYLLAYITNKHIFFFFEKVGDLGYNFIYRENYIY